MVAVQALTLAVVLLALGEWYIEDTVAAEIDRIASLGQAFNARESAPQDGFLATGVTPMTPVRCGLDLSVLAHLPLLQFLLPANPF